MARMNQIQDVEFQYEDTKRITREQIKSKENEIMKVRNKLNQIEESK